MNNDGRESKSLPKPLRLDIQDKLTLGVAAVFTVVAAVGMIVVQGMVSKSIAQLDENAARLEAGRVMGTLAPEIARMIHAGIELPAPPWIPDDDLRALGKKTGSFVSVFKPDDGELTQIQRRAIAELRAGETVFLDRQSLDQWVAYSLINGPGGRGALLVRATIRSQQSSEVTVVMHYAGMLLLALAAVVLIALILLARWIVVRPISKLTRNVVEVGSSADLARRVSLPQDDEIGVLSREFERTLDQLAGAQRSLMAYSFRAGAQDAAVQALHDIGNAAMPVTVSLDLLREALHDLDAASFSKRVAELRAEQDPGRRQALLDLLQSEASSLQDAIAKARDQLFMAVSHSVRIEAILRRTDRVEATLPVPSGVAPRDLVATAIAMLRPEDRTDISIELDPSLDQTSKIVGAHPGLYAVVHAVLTNAVEAIRATGAPGRIDVRGETSPDGNVTIHVVDNGIGIPSEQLRHVFERDFTTKNRTKTMFSLNWCAGVVAASRGSIKVDSKGHGKGTIVTITLPQA